jgi:CBS domain-containing protein
MQNIGPAFDLAERLTRGSVMKASDVMVSRVITIGPDATVRDVANLLLLNRISAVPVVDERGGILGIVSEGDLINRDDTGTTHRTSWWLNALSSKDALAAEYVKSHSQKVSDVMTRDVITASPETSVSEIASLLEKHSIKRVPILKDGKIVGIVSRANLLQGLACMKDRAPQARPADSAIRDAIMSKLNNESWTRPALLTVTVQDGTVDLWGIVDSEVEKRAVGVLTESTPGVQAVNDNLRVGAVLGYS